jgi:hypothetical protein
VSLDGKYGVHWREVNLLWRDERWRFGKQGILKPGMLIKLANGDIFLLGDVDSMARTGCCSECMGGCSVIADAEHIVAICDLSSIVEFARSEEP